MLINFEARSSFFQYDQVEALAGSLVRFSSFLARGILSLGFFYGKEEDILSFQLCLVPLNLSESYTCNLENSSCIEQALTMFATCLH